MSGRGLELEPENAATSASNIVDWTAGSERESRLYARWLGRVPYREAYDLQLGLRHAVAERPGIGYLLLLEHPHVYTLGRRSSFDHLLLPLSKYRELGADVVETDRGGAVTYHGPGQLVAYPIVRLARTDVVAYVRALEAAVVSLLGRLGIRAGRNARNAGVWVGEKKICAIGVRVSRGVTMHGLALNVSTDLSYFGAIVPCGMADVGVTSILAELGTAPPLPEVAVELARELGVALGAPGLDLASNWAPDGPVSARSSSGEGTAFENGFRLRDEAVRRASGSESPGSESPKAVKLVLGTPPADRRPVALDGTPRPSYLRVRARMGPEYFRVKSLVQGLRLHTVCEEAACPNKFECWGDGTATLMILGDTCTRACGFCNVSTGRPTWHDDDEPDRVARAVYSLDLEHAVITSVARDDLPDGGAGIFARTIRSIKAMCPRCSVEVLVPDFKGDKTALAQVVEARPDVLNHNLETVLRLQKKVRGVASYARSLVLLARAKQLDPKLATKSGIMVGLGEEPDEVVQAMWDLRSVGVDILTIGQYLPPSPRHLPVARWWSPEEFDALRCEAVHMGFAHVEAGSLVRSSYRAKAAYEAARRRLAGFARDDRNETPFDGTRRCEPTSGVSAIQIRPLEVASGARCGGDAPMDRSPAIGLSEKP